jgi:hypothetical protein
MPPFQQLQKWQNNQIFEAIQGGGLNPKEFEFEDSGAELRLNHKWSKSCFVFGGNAGHYVGRYVVGDGIDWPYEVYSWQTLMTRFSGWVKDVRGDLDTPDLWAELQRDAGLLGGVSGEANENTPFTSEEQKDIEQRLREMEAHVRRTCSLPEPEMENLHTKIDYLVDAAGRLGRIDWRNAVVGAIVGYILAVGLPPESARSLMTLLLLAIGHFFGHGLPELPIGGLSEC